MHVSGLLSSGSSYGSLNDLSQINIIIVNGKVGRFPAGREHMKTLIVVCFLCMVSMGATDHSWGAQVLNDEEMDQITAGTLSVGMSDDGKFNFLLGGDKSSRLSVEGSGTVAAVNVPQPPSTPASYIIIRDSAQSNLHSFSNVNAVNSKVQVLINLTVNVNSTVGAIHQSNTVSGL
jgi:hypothetical protein